MPFLVDGLPAAPVFASFEALIAYYARWMPLPHLHGLIEAEKEIFIVRRDCSLQETHAQFLRKCEGALARALADAQAGRAAWDWSGVPAKGTENG